MLKLGNINPHKCAFVFHGGLSTILPYIGIGIALGILETIKNKG